MGFLKEFKEFAIKGNMIDMAVGIIIGAAFGKVVTSIVNDLITPPLGLLIGGMDLSNLAITLKEGVNGAGAVVISYGKFIQTAVDFTIVAFAIFMLIKVINTFKRQEAVREEAASEPPPTREEILLAEIRDLLKNK